MTITSIIMIFPLHRKGENYIITTNFCGMKDKISCDIISKTTSSLVNQFMVPSMPPLVARGLNLYHLLAALLGFFNRYCGNFNTGKGKAYDIDMHDMINMKEISTLQWEKD